MMQASFASEGVRRNVLARIAAGGPAHPLWTYDYLMRRADNEIGARDRFRHELTERLIEASTFVADDPGFANFETEKVRRVNEASRTSASESGDFKALAELYAAENDGLRSALKAKTRDIETLQHNVEALMIALRSGQAAAAREAAEDVPPTSVADAVQIARATLSGRIGFSDAIDDQVATVNPTAGPPDKVLRYLRTLGDLSQTLAGGAPLWLRLILAPTSGASLQSSSSLKMQNLR